MRVEITEQLIVFSMLGGSSEQDFGLNNFLEVLLDEVVDPHLVFGQFHKGVPLVGARCNVRCLLVVGSSGEGLRSAGLLLGAMVGLKEEYFRFHSF